MDTADLHDYFRSQMKDDAAPYLWSDDDIIRYMDDAQKMFCRLTGGLADATSEMTQLLASAADSRGYIPTDPRILKIRDAYRSDDGQPVEVVNYEDLPTKGLRLNSLLPGKTRYLIIGMEAHLAVMLPASSDPTISINLLIDRLPLKDITDLGQKIEIDAQHHQHLYLWMQHKAYLKQDSETYDKAASDRAEAAFRTYCEAAKVEKDRAKHKTRVVAYGGL